MAYYRNTAPLIGYYHAKGKLGTVDGLGEIDEIAAEIRARLHPQKPAGALLTPRCDTYNPRALAGVVPAHFTSGTRNVSGPGIWVIASLPKASAGFDC